MPVARSEGLPIALAIPAAPVCPTEGGSHEVSIKGLRSRQLTSPKLGIGILARDEDPHGSYAAGWPQATPLVAPAGRQIAEYEKVAGHR